MKLKLSTLIFVITSVIFYQNCGSPEQSSESGSSGRFNTNTIESLAAYETNLHDTLRVNCTSCHDDISPRMGDTDTQVAHDQLINQGLVNLDSPIDSRIVSVVLSGHQNLTRLIGSQLRRGIENWTSALRLAQDPDDNGGGGDTGPEPIVDPTFQSIYANILVPKCNKCHSPDGIRPREDYTSYNATINTGRVVRGNANASRMYRSCEDQTMPDDSSPLNSQQLGALRDWINAGAPNN